MRVLLSVQDKNNLAINLLSLCFIDFKHQYQYAGGVHIVTAGGVHVWTYCCGGIHVGTAAGGLHVGTGAVGGVHVVTGAGGGVHVVTGGGVQVGTGGADAGVHTGAANPFKHF